MNRETTFSDDRKYRYTLWREWDNESLFTPNQITRQFEYAMFIGLNPSTADEKTDDPTIRRCIDFSKRWGFGALCMTNLFAWRATLPKEMMKSDNPSGPHNHHHLLRCASEAEIVIAAWGKHGKHHHQDLNVRQWMFDIGVKLHHLGLNKDKTPKHPLYLKATTQPILWVG